MKKYGFSIESNYKRKCNGNTPRGKMTQTFSKNTPLIDEIFGPEEIFNNGMVNASLHFLNSQ